MAWAAWLVALVSYLFEVVLLTVNAPFSDSSVGVLLQATEDLSFVILATLGLLILRSQPSNKVGWWIMVVGVTFPLEGLFAEFTVFGVRTRGAIGVVLATGWVSRWIWIPSQLAIPFILLYYPDGTLPSPRWRVASFLSWGVAAGFFVVTAFGSEPTEEFSRLPNPFAIAWVDPMVVAIVPALVLGLGLLPLVGAVSLIPRYRNSAPMIRQQVKFAL